MTFNFNMTDVMGSVGGQVGVCEAEGTVAAGAADTVSSEVRVG